MGLLGILLALGLLIWLAYRGWSVLEKHSPGHATGAQAVVMIWSLLCERAYFASVPFISGTWPPIFFVAGSVPSSPIVLGGVAPRRFG